MSGPEDYFDDGSELFEKGPASKGRPEGDYRDNEYLTPVGRSNDRPERMREQPGGSPGTLDPSNRVWYSGTFHGHGGWAPGKGPGSNFGGGADRYNAGMHGRAGHLSFSSTEIKHLAVATVGLTLAFGFGLSGGIGHLSASSMVIYLIIALVAVCTGFLLHEMAHKIVAQHYGYWAEFRYNLLGLGIAVLMGIFLGFVFAAPGAVYIRGYGISKAENGKISLAGPATNLLLAVVFALLFFFLSWVPFVGLLAFYGLWVNIFLGCFNMIPLGPLDGRKVLKWNVPAFIVMCVLLGVPLILLYTGAAWSYLGGL